MFQIQWSNLKILPHFHLNLVPLKTLFKSQIAQWDGLLPLSQGVSSLQQLIFLRVVDSQLASQIRLPPSCLIAEITRVQCCNMMATPHKQKQCSQSNRHRNWAPQGGARGYSPLHHKITMHCPVISSSKCIIYGARQEENRASCQMTLSSHLLTCSTAHRDRPSLGSQDQREERRRESHPFHSRSSLGFGQNLITSATALAKQEPKDAARTPDSLWLAGSCTQHRLPDPPEHLLLMVLHLPQ